jgi:hypothetical protein
MFFEQSQQRSSPCVEHASSSEQNLVKNEIIKMTRGPKKAREIIAFSARAIKIVNIPPVTARPFSRTQQNLPLMSRRPVGSE